MNNRKRWMVILVFAVAMAWVESSVVLYLRTLLHRVEPYQAEPMPMIGHLGLVEVAREAATMVMLLTVGMLAGTTWRRRLGFTAMAFGVWDICYYLFLRVMCGWPHSVMDWDVLFLIPLPWWGPVLSPMLIALLMILWGTSVTQMERAAPPARPEIAAWAAGVLGALAGLRVFMADTLAAAPHGEMAVRSVLPRSFNWPLFGFALLLMAAPVAQSLWWVLLAEGRKAAPLPLTGALGEGIGGEK
jgi:hypothetical protein